MLKVSIYNRNRNKNICCHLNLEIVESLFVFLATHTVVVCLTVIWYTMFFLAKHTVVGSLTVI